MMAATRLVVVATLMLGIVAGCTQASGPSKSKTTAKSGAKTPEEAVALMAAAGNRRDLDGVCALMTDRAAAAERDYIKAIQETSVLGEKLRKALKAKGMDKEANSL